MQENRRRRTHKRISGSKTLGFENLEERQLLAFDFLFDGTTLTLHQTVDDGIIQIDNSGPASEFQINDGAGFVTYEAAQNVVINLLDNSDNMSVALNSAHTGDLTINAGDGNRSIIFAAAGNSIDGMLTISADAGEQTLSLTQISGLSVGDSMQIDTGSHNDALNLIHPLMVGGDFNLTGVNQVSVGDQIDVVGNVLIDNSGETEDSRFEKSNAMHSSVGGRFTYLGSDSLDEVSMQFVDVDGDINVDHGRNTAAAQQSLMLTNTEFNNLTYNSGSTVNEEVVGLAFVSALGDISIDMGDGDNLASMLGSIEGESVSYTGQGGVDLVHYNLIGPDVGLSIQTGTGNDAVALSNGIGINQLDIDFGGGDDEFTNFTAGFSYDTNLTNLDGIDVTYHSATETLSFDQRIDATVASFELRSDPISECLIFDSNHISTTKNLSVSMIDNNMGSFDFHLEHQLAGDLHVDVGHGPRHIDFLGGTNRIAGDLWVTAGDDDQFFFPDTSAKLAVAGTALVDLGQGHDIAHVASGITTGESLTLDNINEIELIGGLASGGDLNFDTSNDSSGLFFEAHDLIQILGDFNVQGNDQFAERLNLTPAANSLIGGHLNAELRDNLANVNDQYINVNSSMTIEGGVTMLSTSEQISDYFVSALNSTIGGDVLIDLGNGSNIANFGHEVTSGQKLVFVSGSGNDEVILGTSGQPLKYNIMMGGGNDSVTLESTVEIGDLLRIDFGGGEDVFTNNKGAYTWDMRLLNFFGFNNFYEPATDSLRIVQIEDTDNFAVDNNGFANSIQVDVQGGGHYQLTPVTNLQVNLLPGSNTDLALDLNTSINGNVIVDLSHGDRELQFVGSNNNIGGDLRIVAGDGDQHIYLATIHDLTVYGEAVINLRDGVDSIQDSGNQLHFDNNLVLRNVDNYEVTNSLFVGGNMNMVSHWYTQDVIFDNDGTIQIDGKFTYLGSDGTDDVLLGGNVLIGDDVYIQLGESTTPGMGQAVDVSNGFEAASRLTVQAGTAVGGNVFTSDATTRIGGDTIIDFSGSSTSNTAVIKGSLGGNYGTFRGGSTTDSLNFDAVAEDMEWATLMNDGDDEVTLGASTKVLSKFIDFAFGDDLFNDGHLEDFPLWVANLP